LFHISDEQGEWVGFGPAFDPVDPFDGREIEGIGSQAVHRIRWESNHSTLFEDANPFPSVSL